MSRGKAPGVIRRGHNYAGEVTSAQLWSELSTLRKRILDFDWPVMEFFPRYLRHGEGDYHGVPYRLLDYQQEILAHAFPRPTDAEREAGWAYGERETGELLVGMGRGNAKTELAAGCGVFEMAVRHSADVPIGAASYAQANLLYGAACSMIAQAPELSGLLDIQKGDIWWRDNNIPGHMYRVYAKAGTNEGGRPTLLLADELHEWTGEEKERCFTVLRTGLAKRERTFCLAITTAGLAGMDSLAERKYHAFGERKGGRRIWWESDPSLDLTDEAQRLQAVEQANPATRPGGWLSGGVIADRWHEMPESEWRRYHANQWAITASRWLPLGEWQKRAEPSRQVPDGAQVVLGFDGSYSRDSTGLVGSTLDGHVFVVGAWERPAHDPDWRVPRHEVMLAVDAAMERYRVVELAYDPPGWHREAEEWVAKWGEVVVEFPSNVTKRMGEAASRFYVGAVAGSGPGLTHDGDPRLARHIANCDSKPSAYGTLPVKVAPDSPHKIDLAVAAVIAWSRATRLQRTERAPAIW